MSAKPVEYGTEYAIAKAFPAMNREERWRAFCDYAARTMPANMLKALETQIARMEAEIAAMPESERPRRTAATVYKPREKPLCGPVWCPCKPKTPGEAKLYAPAYVYDSPPPAKKQPAPPPPAPELEPGDLHGLDSMIGNAAAVMKLRTFLDAYRVQWRKADKANKPAFPHLLLSGPGGTGKSTLAKIIGRELHARVHLQTGEVLSNVKKVHDLLQTIGRGEILFIDEIHGLKNACQEALYLAMEERLITPMSKPGEPAAAPVKLPPFTLIGATTDEWALLPSLCQRFLCRVGLKRLSPAELADAMSGKAGNMKLSIDRDALELIGARSMGTPRIAKNLMESCLATALAQGETRITAGTVEMTCAIGEIDSLGLDATARRYLEILDSAGGAPVRLNVLASKLDGLNRRTVETKVEPDLVWLGLIDKEANGRRLTEAGRKHLRGETHVATSSIATETVQREATGTPLPAADMIELRRDTDRPEDISGVLIEEKIDGARHTWDGKNLISEHGIIRNDRYPQIVSVLRQVHFRGAGEVAIPGGNVLTLNQSENWPRAEFYLYTVAEFDQSIPENHAENRILCEAVREVLNHPLVHLPRHWETFAEAWAAMEAENGEGVVLKSLDGPQEWKVKRYVEAKVPIAGHEGGTQKGAFVLDVNGVRCKCSAVSAAMVSEYRRVLNAGGIPFAEIEYPFLTDRGAAFQPRLRRIGTREELEIG